ncbi:YdcF family protein [Pseudosulfitobacter pseudonitzschiae]|uniref:YdcF family protein n=1 Tax=Pseudosulfitobacter pseudonitzschiae TaxID=1402135 RepID=UPI003B7916F6
MDTFFFVASKLFWFLARPESWILGLLALGLWALWRQYLAAAQRFVLSSVLLILLIGFVPVGQLLVRPLEARFPAAPEITAPMGIIVLGGGEKSAMSAASGLPEFNMAGERLVMGVALAQQFPAATLIFTGGSASLIGTGVSEADGATGLFALFGVPDSQIVLEHRARNTAENASRTNELVEDPTHGPWVLVTSAFHMPRSLGSFCKAGWRNIIPYPVDYRAADLGGVTWRFAENLDLLNTAVKEWIGLFAYFFTGRIQSLLTKGC